MRSFFSRVLLIITLFTSAHIIASPFYIGGGLGSGKAGDFCQGINEDCDESGTVARLFTGAKFTRFYALEISVDSLDSLTTPTSFVANQDGETDLTSMGITSIVFIPVSSRVSLYASFTGSLNLVSVEVDPRLNSSTVSSNVSSGNQAYSKTGEATVHSDLDWWDLFDGDDDDNNNENSRSKEYESDIEFSNAYSLGVEIKFNRHFYGRAQFRRYKSINGELGFGGRQDVDMLSVNALWRF